MISKKEKYYLRRVFTFSDGLGMKIINDSEMEFTGNKGQRGVILKEKVGEGAYIMGFNVTKFGDKSSARLGVVNFQEIKNKKPIYSLGSQQGSYCLKINNHSLMENGQIMLDNQIQFKKEDVSKPKKAQKKKSNDSDSSGLSEFDDMFNEQEEQRKEVEEEEEENKHETDDYYVLLSIKDPKRLELIKKYKHQIKDKNLWYNNDSSISFFSKKHGYLGSIENLREGYYSFGMSLFGNTSVRLNLMPELGDIETILDEATPQKIKDLIASQKRVQPDTLKIGEGKVHFSQSYAHHGLPVDLKNVKLADFNVVKSILDDQKLIK